MKKRNLKWTLNSSLDPINRAAHVLSNCLQNQSTDKNQLIELYSRGFASACKNDSSF